MAAPPTSGPRCRRRSRRTPRCRRGCRAAGPAPAAPPGGGSGGRVADVSRGWPREEGPGRGGRGGKGRGGEGRGGGWLLSCRPPRRSRRGGGVPGAPRSRRRRRRLAGVARGPEEGGGVGAQAVRGARQKSEACPSPRARRSSARWRRESPPPTLSGPPSPQQRGAAGRRLAPSRPPATGRLGLGLQRVRVVRRDNLEAEPLPLLARARVHRTDEQVDDAPARSSQE